MGGGNLPVQTSEAIVFFEGKESKAMADQLATVSKSRLIKNDGILSDEDMEKVISAIKIQPGIHDNYP